MIDKYLFCENLRKLSSDKDNYINEWLVECKTIIILPDIERRCICCYLLSDKKYIVRNIINGKHVIMGSKCVEHLNKLSDIKKNNKSDKQRKENIILMFEKGVYIKIINLDDYCIRVLLDYLRSRDKNINIEYLKKMIGMYANNETIFDELCKILELKIEEKKKEDIIRIKQKKEEEERIRIQEEKIRIQEERIRIQEEKEENIKLQKEEEKLKNIQLSIQKKEEEKQLKIEKFQIINEKLSFNCNSKPNHLACVDKYYIYKKDVNYKICKFCFNYYIDSKISLEFAR